MGVKKFIKKSVAFVAAAAMALTMVVAPVGAGAGTSYAAEGTTSDSGLNLDKSVELQNDGTYKITLKSYGTGQYSTIKDPIGTPLDIVLVLDQSGSMDEEVNGVKKIDSLKAAVTNFVTSISNNAKGFKEAKHRIAIVGYASRYDSNSEWANTGLFINGSLYNYQRPGSSEKTSRLTDKNYQDALVNVNNSDGSINNSITTAIKNIGANGATYTNYGLEMANKVFSNNPIESGSNRKRIVVVFTDGQPGQSSYEEVVAGSAVNEAYKTKNTYGATVYSVGFYDSADDKVTNFMNYISSNYPGAQAEIKENKKWYPIVGWVTNYTAEFKPGTKSPNTKYYMQATDQTELSKIFNNIYKDIEKPNALVKLDANAVTRDIITDKLNISDNTSVTAYTEDYKGSDSWQKSANQVDLTSTINKDTKTVNVTGFDYAANFVDKTKAKGQRLVVEITGLTAAQAGEGMITNVTDKSGVYANAQTENPSEIFNECSISIPSKSYVLDYGKTVTTAASDYGVSAVTIANADEPSPYNPKDSKKPINLKGEYGTFAINGNDLDYTPGKINWDGIDTGYVFGQKSSSTEYKWEEVNFMPASSVYYEDDFGSFTVDKPNTDSNVAIVWSKTGWTTDGISDKDRQQSSSNSNYGWEQTYEQDKTYSGGSAHVTDNTGLATATFTFTGNGVDVYSRTHDQVGLITARLYRGVGSMTDEGKYKPAVSIKYIDNISKSGDYYQVPTLFFDDLDYDTYTLVITAGMNGSSGYGTYYLDGVRVYNPLGDLSKLTTKEAEKADKAYKDAGEANSQYIRLRDTLLSDGFSKEDEQLDGTVFIDDLGSEVKVGDASVYEKLGPKNEVYLAAGQAVAFQIENYNSDMKVFAGLKALSGNTTNAKVTATYGDGTTTTREISSSNDLYYKIIPDKGRVVIENTGQNLLAITKIRITNIPNNMGKAKLVSTPQLLSYAEGFNNLPQKEESSTDSSENLDKDDVDIDNPSDSGNKEDNDQIDQGTENGDKEDNNQADQGNSQNNSFWNSLKNSLNKWFGRR